MNFSLPEGYSFIAAGDIDSTNDEAKRLIQSGYGDKTVVVANSQSRGRGRGAREWFSPEGNLYLSLLLKPEERSIIVSQISFLTAVALREALLPLLSVDNTIEFKWPNDVLVNEKKIAGILLESVIPANDEIADWLIVGVGVNVAHHPEKAMVNATCLRNEGSSATIQDVCGEFIWHFEEKLQLWREKGFESIRRTWRRCAHGIGQEINVHLANEVLSGIFQDLDEDGMLCVQMEDGKVRKVSSGDVFFL